MKRDSDRRRPIPARTAFTLLEILIVVTIIGLIAGVAIPRARYLLDSIAVRGAGADVVSTLELARQTAMTRSERTTVVIDSSPAHLTILAGADTVRLQNEDAIHGVAFSTNRPAIVYTQLGMGYGVSNLTLVITRGAAAETVVVSRLGRARR